MTNTRKVLSAVSLVALLALVTGVLGAQAAAQTTTAQNNTIAAPTQPGQPVVHDLPPNVPGHTEFLDHKNGFRGITFGTPFSQFKNLEVLHDRGAVKAYRKTDDVMDIGNVTLTQIVYIFVHDKFYAVSLHADGGYNGSNLLKIFQAAFGPGAHPEGTPTKTFWAGKVAGAHFYEDVQPGNEVRGWIGSLDIQKEYEKVQQETFTTAAEQL
jgi:hypothetical protein